MNVKGTDYKQYDYKMGVNDKLDNDKNARTPNSDLDKDAFLHLLTTQLANQDPLDPMDDREFISQLAQFSSLEQMTQFNENSVEMIAAIDALHLNQMEANSYLLKELLMIKEVLAKEFGIDLEDLEDLEKPEKPEGEDGDEEIEEPEGSEKPEGETEKPEGNEDVKARMMAYRWRG